MCMKVSIHQKYSHNEISIDYMFYNVLILDIVELSMVFIMKMFPRNTVPI